MQRVHRQYGKLMKKTGDNTDVDTLLAEFNTAEKANNSFIEYTKAWRDSWDQTLKTQMYVAEMMHLLYKPIEAEEDPDNPARAAPAPTPRRYLNKSADLQTVYSTLFRDLSNDVNSIENRLIRPAMDIKSSLKALRKTIKRREDFKVDYARFHSRVEASRQKAVRSPREETALMKHESDLSRATSDYQAADEQLKQVVPPILDTLSALFPDFLAIQIMIQYAMVGQLYTVLHEFCQTHQLPSPAPEMEAIIATFEAEHTPLRLEMESNFKVLAGGKAVHQPMSMPDKQQGTITGMGIRNTIQERQQSGSISGMGIRNTITRRTSSQGPSPKPAASSQLRLEPSYENQEEYPPPKPTRPSGMSSMRMPSNPQLQLTHNPHVGGRYEEEDEAPPMKPPRHDSTPAVDFSSKPRIPSNSKPSPSALTPGGYASGGVAPQPYSGSNSTSSTPFLTPSSNTGGDYFAKERKPSVQSTMSSIAGKKKPPPPPPKPKRFPSAQSQFVTAMFDFPGQGDGDLSFREGDLIKVVKKTESTDDWWEGELKGVLGSFPANYVKVG